MTEETNSIKSLMEDALGIVRDFAGAPCVVSHPDAVDGRCERPGAVKVWGLPFCELHGAEAEAAAFEDLTEELDSVLGMLARTERERLSNPVLVELLDRARTVNGTAGGRLENTRANDEALARAYPAIEGSIDPDTLAFDYDARPGSGPVDWWSERRWLLWRFMREARLYGLSGLVRELEPLRERERPARPGRS